MNDKINTIAKWLGSGSVNIFGRPFAGKDTQGKRLADMFGGDLISGGDILRSYPDQEELKKYMSAGELIPSDLFMKIVLPYLSKDELAKKPLILSSVGRLVGEEPIIYDACINSGHPIKAVILLELPEETVWSHFEKAKDLNDRGNRSDDNGEVLKNRLHEFQTKTMPVVEFYKNKGLLISLDGSLTRDEVTNEITEALYNLAK